MGAALWYASIRGVEFEDPGSSKSWPLRGDRTAPLLRGVFLVTAPRRASPVSKSRSAGLFEDASRSCAHGLLLGSSRSRAARLSLLRSRMPRALISRFAGVRYKVSFECDVVTVGPDEMERVPLSEGGAVCSYGRTAAGLVSMCNPRAAGAPARSLEGSSCHPNGVGGMGVKLV
jgi:hypothetical protein